MILWIVCGLEWKCTFFNEGEFFFKWTVTGLCDSLNIIEILFL